MMALYRKEILKEPVPDSGFIPVSNLIGSAPKPKVETEEPVLGD